MFNWICPQCGSEVLASYSECPQCSKGNATQPAMQPFPAQAAPLPIATPPPYRAEPARSVLYEAPPTQQIPVAQAPVAQPQQPYYPPQQPQPQPQPQQPYPQFYAQQPQRTGMPTWLMSILFAVGFVLLGSGVYWLLNHNKDSTSATTAAPGDAATTTGAAGKPNPMQKFVEVTGVRLFQNNKKQVEAKFLIVNHSEGEISDLGGVVEIRGRTAKEGELPVGTFKFKISSIGPNDAKEATAPVATKLKVYELPDWQLVDARVQITSP